ncbi:hypothetical protein VDGD_20451 [Verticillium dahliae]|nr:hypothetical protein VDGD_20451 [Verticillium dahliae]
MEWRLALSASPIAWLASCGKIVTDTCLLGLAALGINSLSGFELGNLLLDGLVDASLKLLSVTQQEQKLEPDEKGRQEDGLDKVIEQRGGALLESTVADELEDPADNVGD